jgi:hypothetical protein
LQSVDWVCAKALVDIVRPSARKADAANVAFRILSAPFLFEQVRPLPMGILSSVILVIA